MEIVVPNLPESKLCIRTDNVLSRTFFWELKTSSGWNTKRPENMVRRTRESTMRGVSFSELRRKEKKELKVNWVAQMMENVGTGN